MILEELRLQNFRCFFGEPALHFASNPSKNVTLIYAENGVGKTTLLNALLWCMYGETTARFELKEDILNHDAKADGAQEAWACVQFEHENRRYAAKRFAKKGGATDFRVARVESGSHVPLETPDTFINSVIPKDMAGHFLFDGEHAENFSGEKNRSKVQAAVRDILGCTMVETAIEDLKAIGAKYRRQATEFSSSSDLEEIEKRIQKLQEEIVIAQSELRRLGDERASVADQANDIERHLRNTAQVTELQNARARLEQQLEKAKARRRSAQDEVYKWLGDQGRFVVSTGITEQTYEFLEREDMKARIPAPYNEEFVRDLLAGGNCICGRPLSEGSHEVHEVRKLLDRAANKVMTDRLIRIRARISNLRDQRKKAPHKLMEATRRLAEENENINTLENQIGEYGEKIKGIDIDEIRAREEKYQELKGRLREIDRAAGALADNISRAEATRKALDAESMELSERHEEAKRYVRRRNLCEQLKGQLESKLTHDEKETRGILRAKIRKIIDEATRKNFTFRMEDDYTMQLLNESGVAMAKSGGENQLLGLAFTAALVEFAKVRQKASDFALLPGTIAPLVLDSPFGQLDDNYRESTAKFLPRMAQQVVLLLSSSQSNAAIVETLAPHVGKQYVLVRHNKGRIAGKRNERRRIGNRDYEITRFDSEFNGTEIVEVK